MLGLAFEDQRHFIGVLALKSSGVLDQECTPEIMDRLVAQRLWIDHSAIREVKRRLIEAGLIFEDWTPKAWEKRQFVSDKDPTRAERQQRYRAKKSGNALHNAPSNASVTPLDTDTDTDKGANAPLSEPAAQVADRADACPHQKIIAIYHQVLPELPGVIVSRWATSQGAANLRTRWREDRRHQEIDFWTKFFSTVRTSKHWMGENERGWQADLRWLLERRNFDKVLTQMVALKQREACHG